MISYCLTISHHYSGQMCAHFPDFPGMVVLGRDHEEVTGLALEALEAELQRRLELDGNIPQPREQGVFSVSTARFG